LKLAYSDRKAAVAQIRASIPKPALFSIKAIFPYQLEDELKFEFFGGSHVGYFVDIGANDPRDGSQTWPFEQLGWEGVLVEPQHHLAERLRQERRAKVYGVACSSPKNSGKSATLNLAGIHTSLNPDFFVAGMQRVGTSNVLLRTLDEILIDAKAPAPIDFVSIDVEGHELEVLEGFDLNRWRPRLILIEDLAFNLGTHRHLTRRGYKWMRRTGINGWYVPADSRIAVSPMGRLQFLRKHYLGVPFRNLREWKRRQSEKRR
jgi:FkbM family methyltransferase